MWRGLRDDEGTEVLLFAAVALVKRVAAPLPLLYCPEDDEDEDEPMEDDDDDPVSFSVSDG